VEANLLSRACATETRYVQAVRFGGDMANVTFLFAWGVRVCVRGVPKCPNTFVLPSACDAFVGKGVWTWLLCAPTVYAVAFDAQNVPNGLPLIGGFRV
jgi:hypothetical protein